MNDPHRQAARFAARVEQDEADLTAQLGLRDAWRAVGHADAEKQAAYTDRAIERLASRLIRGEAEALKRLELTIGQRPDDAPLIWATAGACRRAGKFEKATDLYLAHLKLEPESPFTGFLLDACRQRKSDGAPPGYVKALSAETAEHYDALMAEMEDIVPDLVAAALKKGAGGAPFEALDVGCGTGRLGALIKPFTKRLTGLDLSPAMLKKAAERGCYDYLEEGEALAYLRDHNQGFNRVLACDLSGYLGDLNQFMPLAAGALRKSGQLILTVETCERGHQLHPSGRYQHSAHHVRRRAKQSGFEIKEMTEHVFRQEDTPIEGLLFILKKL